MKIFIFACLISFFPLNSLTWAEPALNSTVSSHTPLDSESISEKELQDLLTKLHEISNARDVDAIRNLLWDDARFVLVSRDSTVEMTVPEYIEVLKDTWSQTKNYTYEYQKDQCQPEGNRLICTGTVKETMVLTSGQFITSSVKGKDIFEKRRGAIKIIFSQANTDEATVGSRQSPHAPLEMMNNSVQDHP